MTKNFILTKNPSLFIKTVERDYYEMISGTVTEEEAVEYVSNLLPLARACNFNKKLWFWLIDEPENMPGDARVGLIYEPTYMLTATVLYAMSKYEAVSKLPNISYALENILNGCMGRQFQGHGFDGNYGFITAMKIFANANITEFLEKYGSQYPAFNEFFDNCVLKLTNKYLSGIAGSEINHNIHYIDEAFDIIRTLEPLEDSNYIFVYGTLMKGQPANYLLNDAGYMGKFKLSDFAMYNLGAYPGIKACAGESVVGEVYEVSDEMLTAMDSYEGSQYDRKVVTVCNSESKLNVFAYVYNGNISGNLMRESWNANDSDEVWYACYGSNLQEERFNCYIKGGLCKENGKTYPGCRDDLRPSAQKLRNYKGTMYYGNNSSSWGGKGVSFFDPNGEGKTIMRLYKISREQLHDIQAQEGLSANWYGKIVCLDVIDDCPVYTLTSEHKRPENAPSKAYMDLMYKALVNECGVFDEEAREYLNYETFIH